MVRVSSRAQETWLPRRLTHAYAKVLTAPKDPRGRLRESDQSWRRPVHLEQWPGVDSTLQSLERLIRLRIQCLHEPDRHAASASKAFRFDSTHLRLSQQRARLKC